MIDLHVHTALCRHAEGEPRDYLDSAVERGLSVLGFTDHLPLLDRDDTDYTMARCELPSYIAAVSALEPPEDLTVLLGVEADWLPGRESDTKELLESHPFDVVLGSVHFIDDWAFDDPRLRARYDEWDIDALWERYFSELGDAAESGLFDVMAHPDLIKKFGIRPAEEPVRLFDEAAERMVGAGVAVELSTGGLRKPVGETYPSREFLSRCRRAGVPITIGSDAHCPAEVGYAYEVAAELARSVGYRGAVVFEGREMREVGL